MTPARVVLVVATILTGLSAGFFFTYEASVTLGLAEVDDVTYVTTFQAINETIGNAWFGIVFFGAIPAIALALAANWRTPVAVRAAIGAGLVLYLICLAVTAAGNVPLNDELALFTEITPESAARARAAFEDGWNRLNLVRTLAVIGAFASLVVATALAPRSRTASGS